MKKAVYNPKKIEKKWQKEWEKKGLFKAKDFSKKKKFYVLIEFPYPSGVGLHTGHCRSYTAMDVLSRKKRMEGYNVLYPMGWDAFGLPTENYAIKTGLHPSVVTKQNTDTFRNQLKKLGLSFDWEREINTTNPNYYKWTQWIFIQLFNKGLAYKEKCLINWCPSCKIGLANEEVVLGNCERCGEKTEKKEKEQWMIKITKYADRLLKDLEKVDYLERIKIQQKEWIGRSEGVNLKNKIKDLDIEFEVYDSIPQTFMAQTFTVIAPDHPLLKKLVYGTEFEKPVLEFAEKIIKKRQQEKYDDKTMEGIFTGRYVKNYCGTGHDLPIWVASYVVMDYGTGIVNCSAHDERDFSFAKKYNIPLKPVLFPKNKELAQKVKNLEIFYREPDGILQEPKEFTGLTWEEARKPIIEYIIKNGFGKVAVHYKLRDWVFSRQHYWGEPIPMVYCDKCGYLPVKEKDLPIELPKVKNYKPSDTGESPLSLINSWVNTKCPKCKGNAERETDTMPNWAGSNWYFLRYLDVNNNKKLADFKKIKYWMPVDWYNGGMEHTTLHLLYSRFIFKFLYDIGAVPKEIGPEPYKKRTSHGKILGKGGIKMSKSLGNTVNPDEITDTLGADTLRIYTMFMGPFDQAIAWDDKGINGAKRFLEKVFSISVSEKSSNLVKKELQKTIGKVSNDINSLKFNTAISSLMEFSNILKREPINKEDYRNFLIILSPFAPHITEELWQNNGFKDLCFNASWPKFNIKEEEEIELIVQINGRFRAKVETKIGSTEKEIIELALSKERIKELTKDKKIKKTIFVPKKLINFVIDN